MSAEHNSGTRHQDLAPIFLRNGAIFLSRVDYLERERRVIDNQPMVYEMPLCRSVDIDDFRDLEKAEKYIKSVSKRKETSCMIIRRRRIPSLEEAMRIAERYSRQIILEDLLRIWLYEMRGERSVDEHLVWTEDHVYFDGIALLADGECLNHDLLQSPLSAGKSKAKKDPRIEAYLQKLITSLTKNTDSCIVKTDLY